MKFNDIVNTRSKDIENQINRKRFLAEVVFCYEEGILFEYFPFALRADFESHWDIKADGEWSKGLETFKRFRNELEGTHMTSVFIEKTHQNGRVEPKLKILGVDPCLKASKSSFIQNRPFPWAKGSSNSGNLRRYGIKKFFQHMIKSGKVEKTEDGFYRTPEISRDEIHNHSMDWIEKKLIGGQPTTKALREMEVADFLKRCYSDIGETNYFILFPRILEAPSLNNFRINEENRMEYNTNHITPNSISQKAPKSLKRNRRRNETNRPGQRKFRKKLLDYFKGKCPITGCSSAHGLEACHIIPYSSSGPSTIPNGILLRSDWHKILDLGGITIDPSTGKLLVSPKFQKEIHSDNTTYGNLAGKKILGNEKLSVSRKYWERHFKKIYKE